MLLQPKWGSPQPGPFRINTSSPQARDLVALYCAFDYPLVRDGTRDGYGRVRRWSSAMSVVWDSDMGWVFNGINNVRSGITVPSHVPDYITYAAWIKTTSDGQIFSCDDTSGNRHHQFRVNGGKLDLIQWRASDSSFDTQTSAADVNTGAWVHVAGTYDGANIQTYVNGVASGSPKAFAGVCAKINLTWAIGAIGGSPADESYFYNFIGQIAEARAYERALSAEEILALYDPVTRWDIYQPVSWLGALLPLVSGTARAQGPAVQHCG